MFNLKKIKMDGDKTTVQYSWGNDEVVTFESKLVLPEYFLDAIANLNVYFQKYFHSTKIGGTIKEIKLYQADKANVIDVIMEGLSKYTETNKELETTTMAVDFDIKFKKVVVDEKISLIVSGIVDVAESYIQAKKKKESYSLFGEKEQIDEREFSFTMAKVQ